MDAIFGLFMLSKFKIRRNKTNGGHTLYTMKKVLIITYIFIQSSIIGAVRLRGLAKYLYALGWEPTILTAKLPNVSEPRTDMRVRVIETPYEDLLITWKKRLGLKTDKTLKEQFGLPTYKNKNTIADFILNCWAEFFAYPDVQKGWYKFAVDAANKLLQEECFDVIISSSSPATSHLIAKELKNKHGIPWIADLRDLWTQNHYYHYTQFRKFIERRLEVRTLSAADALTTVSQPLTEKLKELHKGKDVYAIPNGFDPAELVTGSPLSDNFSIVYTGHVYKGKQDPEPLFNAIQKLILEGIIEPDEAVIDFYGYDEGWLERDVERFGLQDIVNVHGLIPREEALKKQREAQILLLLTWNDPTERGVYTGKVFDYLAARRPILSVGISGGVVEALLKETNAGVHTSSQEEIERALKKMHSEFKLKGRVGYGGINTKIERYSQREMARKFADVLDSLAKR